MARPVRISRPLAPRRSGRALAADYVITLERTQMKRQYTPLLVLMLAAAGCSRSPSDTHALATTAIGTTNRASQDPDSKIPPGAINFLNAPLQEVLAIYGSMSGAELVVEPEVRLPPALITISNQQSLTRAEALNLIAGTLRDRAGLVVERQDAKHFTVKPAK